MPKKTLTEAEREQRRREDRERMLAASRPDQSPHIGARAGTLGRAQTFKAQGQRLRELSR